MFKGVAENCPQNSLGEYSLFNIEHFLPLIKKAFAQGKG